MINISNLESIALLGFAREGQSTYEFLTKQKGIKPEKITILDIDASIVIPTGSKGQLGGDYLNSLNQFDLIIRSSGASIYQKALQDYVKKGGTLISHMTLFFEEYKGKVIGITGSKGKSTTTQLIFNILQHAGYQTVLVGNIGIPALTSINRDNPPEYVVAELSSYMLEDAQVQCEIAIITNLYHEHHAQRHQDIDTYRQSKWKITNNAKHILLGSQIKNNIPKNIKKYSSFGDFGAYYIKDKALYIHDQRIININDIKLQGEHNYYNACAMLGVCDILHIDKKYAIQELKEFNGLAHRLEYVGEYNQIHRYDDAIASTPESTIAALKTIPAVATLFLGGKDGGYNYDQLITYLGQSEVKNIVLYPETGGLLLPKLQDKFNCYYTKNLEDGIQRARENTPTDHVALLSCGAAYTLGIGFEEKGARFKKYLQSK